MSDRSIAVQRALAVAAFVALTGSLLACGSEPSDRLAAIRAQQAAGDFAGSVAALDALIAERPDDAELHYLRGLAQLRSGQPSMAVWSFRKAMEDPAWLQQAGLQLAASSLQTANPEAAIDATGRILEAQPENVAALALRAEAKMATRRDDAGALADAERALELDPDEQSALVTRAVALLSLERVDEAAEALKVLEERVLEADLGSETGARFCLVRATFLKEKGDIAAAEQAFESCLEKYPRNPNVVFVVIKEHDQAGRPERSTEILRAALAAEPQATEYRVQLAMRLDHAGEKDEALRLLREGTEQQQDPQLAAVAWVDLANLQTLRGELDDAIASLAKAIELSPDPRPELLFQHAETLLMAGRYPEAREAAAKLTVPAHRELIVARTLLAEGNPKQALERFDAGLALWPNNAVARYYAARAAEQLGDFDRAILEYRYAIRAGIDETDARYRLARLHEAEHAYAQAVVVGRHASTVPADPAAERVALRVLARLGRLGEVRDVIEVRAQQPELWGATVAAMAEGIEQGKGAAEAAKLIRDTRGLDLREPRNLEALRVLVQVSCAAGDAKSARAAADAAIAAQPEDAAFHALRGDALACEGAPAGEVRAAYERALALDAKQIRALAGLADLTARAGDAEGALAIYARLADADREELADPTPRRAWAELLVKLGRRPEAEKQLEELLRLNPYDSSAAARLAELRGGDAALAQRAARFAEPEKSAPVS